MRQKIAVITGASAGIGRATAEAFGRRGWRVALLARGVDGLEGARAAMQAAGGEAFTIPTDVADHAQVEAAAERIEREWGPIDVWINDAMATIFCEVAHISPEDFRRATEVTYLGAVWGTMAALKRMTARNRGAIVQVGSALAYRQHHRRELWVGLPAVEAILGTRLVPRFLDRRLAYEAYSGQHTEQPVSPRRDDNLYAPVPGDHGAHGRFDAQAVHSSLQLWFDLHRRALGAVLVVAATIAALAMSRR